MKTKKEIREEVRRKLHDQSQRERVLASGRIQRSLYRLEEFRRARVVLVTLSCAEEVDTLRIVKRCLGTGKMVVVPRVTDEARGKLELRQIRNLEGDLARGAYGILEPRPAVTRVVKPGKVDCAILPGLAFDRRGNRLGRGKGFFDRLLAAIPREVPRIALAFKFQLVDRLPVWVHDRPVDIVLSS